MKVWTGADQPSGMAIGRGVAAVLRSLGYRASLATAPTPKSYYDLVMNPRTHAQVGISDWGAAYPSPAGFFGPLLTCAAAKGPDGSNLSRFCDPRLDRMIGRSDWTAVDRAVVDRAPLVPLAADRQATLISPRVGNYEYNANLGGVLIDQLWRSKSGSFSVH